MLLFAANAKKYSKIILPALLEFRMSLMQITIAQVGERRAIDVYMVINGCTAIAGSTLLFVCAMIVKPHQILAYYPSIIVYANSRMTHHNVRAYLVNSKNFCKQSTHTNTKCYMETVDERMMYHHDTHQGYSSH